jgi:hypothetical protein
MHKRSALFWSLAGLATLGLAQRNSSASKRRSPSLTPPPATENTVPATHPLPHYDIRWGAKAYAPIIGTIGGLIVPALIVVFVNRPAPEGVPLTHVQVVSTTYAVGLLVLALFATLGAAFVFAALGAETHATPSIPASSMWAAVPASVGIVSLIGAFDCVASLFLASSASLFLIITVGTGLVAAALTAFAINDSYLVGPLYDEAWRSRQWLKSRHQAERRAYQCMGACFLAIGSAGVARIWVRVTPDKHAVEAIIGIGLALSLIATLVSAGRARHRDDIRDERALGWPEAVLTCALLTIYVCGVVLTLP